MKIKICGITNLDDALLCQQCGADAVGFIFYKKSKRFILPEAAAEISKALSPLLMKVGVFVDEDASGINRTASLAGLNAVQLHSGKDIINSDLINLPVIKAYRINDEFDFSTLYNSGTHYFLLDAYSEKEYGGTGKKFNWSLIPGNLRNRIILAGGISAESLEEIFNNIKPAAIDLSSSLEKVPGKKDTNKVLDFFKKFNSLKEEKC